MTSLDPIALGLPHRAPFIFIDEVTELVPGERAMARKIFSASEPFFRGHFPDDPLVPGVILTEALAQTAGVAAGVLGAGFRLTAIKTMKFLAAVRAHESISFYAIKRGVVSGLWQFDVEAKVGDAVVASGVIVLSEI